MREKDPDRPTNKENKVETIKGIKRDIRKREGTTESLKPRIPEVTTETTREEKGRSIKAMKKDHLITTEEAGQVRKNKSSHQ